MMFDMVVFDFADTIARLEPSKEEILQRFVKEKLSIELPISKIQQTYFYIQNQYFYSSVKIVDFNQKRNFYKAYNKAIFHNLGIFHLIEPFLDDFFIYFSKIEKHWTLKKEALELLVYLQESGVKIGLISNFDIVLHDILKTRLCIKDFFSYIHISQEVGYEKPDIKFYENFIDKYAVDPKTTIYIGDNYELDFLPSHYLGFNSILLDENQNYTGIPSLKKINSLLEVKTIFEKQQNEFL